MDHGEVLRQQFVADDGADNSAMDRGNSANGGLDFSGAKVTRGRVDEVATKSDRFDRVGETFLIDADRQRETGDLGLTTVWLLRFVTAVAIGAQRPRQCGQFGLRKAITEPVGACW